MIITLNVNGIAHKLQDRFADWTKKKWPNYMVSIRNFLQIQQYR